MALQNKLRDQLAEQFIASLDEGRLPWTACWMQQPEQNAVTGKPYRGVNSMWLAYVAEKKGYADPRWCTFNQAQEKGWKIQKGSKGVYVEYWAYYDRLQKKLLPWKEANALLKDQEYAEKNLQLRCRLYTVFNAEQIEGIPKLELPQTNIDEIRQQRDTLLKNMELRYEEHGSSAFYSPLQDTVVLPPEHTFLDVYSYTCTFLHECGHATAHPSRLNREIATEHGSDAYAREELRAEIASAFTAQSLGLQLTNEQLQAHNDLHKAYIQGWASVLKDAPGELFRAIKDAEQISNYLIKKGEFEPIQTRQNHHKEPDHTAKSENVLEALIANATQRTAEYNKNQAQDRTPILSNLER